MKYIFVSRAVCVSCVSVAHREITKRPYSKETHHTKHIFHVAFNGFYVKIIWSILVKDCVLLGKGKVVFVYISYVQFCFYI